MNGRTDTGLARERAEAKLIVKAGRAATALRAALAARDGCCGDEGQVAHVIATLGVMPRGYGQPCVWYDPGRAEVGAWCHDPARSGQRIEITIGL